MEMGWITDADEFASEFPAVAADLDSMLDREPPPRAQPFVLTDEGGHRKDYMSEAAIRAHVEPRGCTNADELSAPKSDAIVVVVETVDRGLVAFYWKRTAA